MSGNGAREVILAYLSTYRIGPGQKALRSEVEVWCFDNQGRYDVEVDSDTYQQQMRRMIIGSGKWKTDRDNDGLNDVFCPCSSRLVERRVLRAGSG